MAIAKRVFYSFSLSFLREKTNIGVTIENAFVTNIRFSLEYYLRVDTYLS